MKKMVPVAIKFGFFQVEMPRLVRFNVDSGLHKLINPFRVSMYECRPKSGDQRYI